LYLGIFPKGAWGRIVEDVRTIIQRQNEYIYIPDLRPEAMRV